MNFVQLLLALALMGGAYHFWNARDRTSGLGAADLSPSGFVSQPAPANLSADTVIVLAAENCPEEDARRADSMAEERDGVEAFYRKLGFMRSEVAMERPRGMR